jgi:hypothetical protein
MACDITGVFLTICFGFEMLCIVTVSLERYTLCINKRISNMQAFLLFSTQLLATVIVGLVPLFTGEFKDYGGFICATRFFERTPGATLVGVMCVVFCVPGAILCPLLSNYFVYTFYVTSVSTKATLRTGMVTKPTNHPHTTVDADHFIANQDATTTARHPVMWSAERILMIKCFIIVGMVWLGWFVFFVMFYYEFCSGEKAPDFFAYGGACFMLAAAAVSSIAHILMNPAFKDVFLSWFRKV